MRLFSRARPQSMIEEDTQKTDQSCNEIESLQRMIENAQERIKITREDFQQKKEFYEANLRRLQSTEDFVRRLLAVE